LLPTFTDAAGTSHDHPTLGHVIADLSANGLVQALNTPVSFIEYVHENGTSSVVTDWSDLEFNR
jgi:hypothetical protein